ncbi:FAD/NAD(P)-binding domain-containing protein [Marasmius fiardii PR-910]|nr:FAD/NAD(P)-binding domain-containing protein [Marasmius fiardii PR-910]
MSQPPCKVIIVGCGVAGPVLALLLKLEGYHSAIYERSKQNAEAGVSLMLQTNGWRVLSLIPGLVDKLPGKVLQKMKTYSTVPEDEGLLGEADSDDSTIGMGIGVRRQEFLYMLAESAVAQGVEIHWERKVVDLHCHDESVDVVFDDGHIDSASFVVGCDGLHSIARTLLFGKEEASFTGLVQTGGFSRRPEPFSEDPSVVNFLGIGTHIITYQISDTHYSWVSVITRREAEMRETWRSVDNSMLERLRGDECSLWKFGAGDLIRTAERIVKYGLYDRPQLQTWHRGRVVLVGDAAHPTSPASANQALEDVYHLVRCLVKYNPKASSPSTTTLESVFNEYEAIRIPRTSVLVQKARAAGEARVVEGLTDCLGRNEKTRRIWQNKREALQDFEENRAGPYSEASEI